MSQFSNLKVILINEAIQKSQKPLYNLIITINYLHHLKIQLQLVFILQHI